MIVAAPAGWHGGASQELVEQTGRAGHFGGVHGVIEAERYDAPEPGVVLYATRVAANTASPADAAAAELANFGHPTDGKQVADKAFVVESAWHDGDVSGTARMIIAATADRIVAVKGECYAGADARAERVAECTRALATLDVGIAVKDRVDLTVSSVPPAPTLTTPSLTETHVALPPIQVHEEGPDRRPVYVGAGLIVLAGIFWWNRRRRTAHDR